MFERMVGASAPLANRISNFSAPNIMGTAQAAEVIYPIQFQVILEHRDQ